MSERPGCVLFLLQGSAGLDAVSRCAARLYLDQALDALLHRLKRFPTLEVAVIGYERQDERIAFTSLLPAIARAIDLVPLAELKAPESRQIILERLSFAGKPAPAEGLAHAHQVLQTWLTAHAGARPPVVLHCGERRGYGHGHARLSRSIRLLGPGGGAVGLAHHVLASDRDFKFLGQPREVLSRNKRMLWKHSSPLLLGTHANARALAINSDPLPLVKGLLRQTRPLRLATAPSPARMRVLSLPRRGPVGRANEDVHGCHASHGLAVLSDGASSGVFAKEWASGLVESFLAGRPDPLDAAQFTAWLNRRRLAWQEHVRLASRTPIEQVQAQHTGAAATFLCWQLGSLPNGTLAWQGWAVGDTCLFWVRGNRLRASFPLAHSRQFAAAPALLGTWPQVPEPAPLFGAGLCKPGDLFVLATDALARCFLTAVERGKEPDWNELETITDEAWRTRVETLRDSGKLANDDATLVLARAQR